MIKILLSQFKQYTRAAVLTPVFTGLEALLELLIPFITAKIIDEGIEAGNLQKIYLYGGIMLIMAFLSLISGVMAGKNAAEASSGFASNLRESMYENIQKFFSPGTSRKTMEKTIIEALEMYYKIKVQERRKK